MAIRIDIERDGLVPGIKPAQVRQIKTAGLHYIASRWHQLYSAIHFTPAGARRYSMKRRRTKDVQTGRVNRGTRKKYGGLPISGSPNVWTGATRAQAKNKTIEANSKRSHCKMPIGHVNRYRPKGFPAGQIRFEITRVLPSEERNLGREAERGLRSQFSKKKKNISVTSFRN